MITLMQLTLSACLLRPIWQHMQLMCPGSLASALICGADGRSLPVLQEIRLRAEYNPCLSNVDPVQEDFLEDYKLPLQACQTFSTDNSTSASAVDYYEDSFSSIRNLMCQLNSIAAAAALWRQSGRQYGAVAYLRPDVLFNCALLPEWVQSVKQRTVYVADFHHWHGFNDRFALGTPETMALWGDRCASQVGDLTASCFLLLQQHL